VNAASRRALTKDKNCQLSAAADVLARAGVELTALARGRP